MLKFINENSRSSASLIAINSYYVKNSIELQYASQNISYDHPEQYSALLLISVRPGKHFSLNFEYVAKDFSDKRYSFSIINTGDENLFISASSYKEECAYTIEDKSKQLMSIVRLIIDINAYRTQSQKYFCGSGLSDQGKNLLQQFVQMTRTILLTNKKDDYPLTNMLGIFANEAELFKDVIAQHEAMNKEHSSPGLK